ncbi:MAG: c-type cytochrome [Planctomycetaceae bacterium]|nr:c-type cytochrome [bacterium]MDB4680104.1 c-type cytochrome [Planctomycetaceae bacterium]MDB4786596.1 c-type cytochrome [Planctomycetaceae bacterium]MDG2389435.1 c-type cytochrome [Planctomycetaceae bacterium]
MSIRQNSNILFVLACGFLFVGCDAFSPPDAVFVVREETNQLTSNVSNAVEAELDNSFGNPHQLVAWLKLPVDFGGVMGATEESTLEGPLNKFPVTFDTEADEKFIAQFQNDDGDFKFGESGARLDWMTGEYAGKSMQVIGYDAETQLLTTKEKVEVPPAAGDTFVLSAGDTLKSGRALYMEHCLHCHGVSGDGNGPTALYLNPRPRDYRLGQFKFKSTKPAEKVRQEGLGRVIKYGIPGTYMPSFLLLEDEELYAIVEYVRWLSMRGELEYRVDQELVLASGLTNKIIAERKADGDDSEEIQEEIDEAVANMPVLFDDLAGQLAESWLLAEEEGSLIVPAVARVEDSFESRARGRKFFLEKCTNCHGHKGRGNGSMTEDYQKNEETGELYAEPGLFDIWGNSVKPRNLTQGVYRGGRRPVDLFYRLYGGIGPSKMPNFATTDPQILWDTVNYVLHVPFETPGEYIEVDKEYFESKKKSGGDEEKAADEEAATTETKQTATGSTESSDQG